MSLAYELISVSSYHFSEKEEEREEEEKEGFFFSFASMKELVITLALIHLKNMKASPIAT